ncbi:hypothetical protein HGB07_07005 [Candidatus Roizmanbacteria bacterium]|nr:hypothetical protein [Candidatus Roizmanbacteria bacterium]
MLNQATFKDLEIPFIAVATDYHSGDTVSLQTGNIAKALRASISVPAFLQPVEYHNRLLADGGLSDPVPADIVRQMGVDIVIAINLDMVPPETEHITIPSIHVVPAHAIDILQHHLALRSVKSADVVIAPDVAHIGWVGWDHFFNQTKTQKLIATGEEATLAAIPQIKEIITLKKKGQPLLRRVLNIFH